MEQTGVPGENPRQPARWSVSHIRGENRTSWTGIKPWPSNFGDKLAWPRAHAVSDPLSWGLPRVWKAACPSRAFYPTCVHTAMRARAVLSTRHQFWQFGDFSNGVCHVMDSTVAKSNHGMTQHITATISALTHTSSYKVVGLPLQYIPVPCR